MLLLGHSQKRASMVDVWEMFLVLFGGIQGVNRYLRRTWKCVGRNLNIRTALWLVGFSIHLVLSINVNLKKGTT
jgi:hypothetical protein